MKSKVITGLVLTLFLIGMLTLAFNVYQVEALPAEYQDLYSEATNIFITNWFLDYGRQQFTLNSNMTIDAVALYVVDWGVAWIGYDGDEIDLVLKDSITQSILATGVFTDTTQTGWIYVDLSEGVQLQAQKTYEIEFTVPIGDPSYKTAVHFAESETDVGNTWTRNPWALIVSPNVGDHAFKLAMKSKTVDDNGPADFHTIQEAINAATEGDTIFVRNGTYYENVVLNKSVSLIGENKVTTIIDGNMSATVVVVTADNVIISQFTIRNGGNYAGISLSSNGNSITDNILWNNWRGISLEHYSAYNVIANNSITNNLNGVAGELWYDSTIIGNDIRDNLLGIWVGPYSMRNTIVFNNIRNHWSEGISMWQSSNNTFEGNNITDNNRGGYWAGITIGFQVGFSSGNKFFHNNIANNGKQIDLQGQEEPIMWDDGYPSGGNYWSDHVCTGNPSNGSQPYIIDANNIDHYPFQDPNGWLLPKPPVGGTIVPINKLELLAPYISVVSVILVTITVAVKKRRLNHIKG